MKTAECAKTRNKKFSFKGSVKLWTGQTVRYIHMNLTVVIILPFLTLVDTRPGPRANESQFPGSTSTQHCVVAVAVAVAALFVTVWFWHWRIRRHLSWTPIREALEQAKRILGVRTLQAARPTGWQSDSPIVRQSDSPSARQCFSQAAPMPSFYLADGLILWLSHCLTAFRQSCQCDVSHHRRWNFHYILFT